MDYYAQVGTSLTYQLEQRVRRGKHGWRWAVVKRYKTAWDFSEIAQTELENGWGLYERRETNQNVPMELLYPQKRSAPKYRVVYSIWRGKSHTLLKRGVVSRKPCRKIDDPPYYIP